MSRFTAATVSLVAVPVIVRELGLMQFGVWESMVAIASLGTILTGPAGGTLLWRMSQVWGSENRAALRGFLRGGIAGACALTIVALPIGVAFRQPVAEFLGIEPSQRPLVETLFVWLVAMVGLTALNEVLGALQSAMQRVRITSAAQTTGQIAMYIVTLLGLRAGFGLAAMLFGLLAGQLTTSSLLAFSAWKAFRLLPPDGALSDESPADTGRYFALLTVGSVSAALRGQTDRVILAGLASPTWAGYYGLAVRLTNLLMEYSNLLYVPTIAAVGALSGARRWGAVRSLFLRASTAMIAGGAFLGLVLLGLAEPLITLWLGRPVSEAALLLRILTAGTLVAVVITGPGTAVCKGIGRPDIETRYVVLGLVLNVILTIGLSMTIGPIGTVIASSLSWSASSAYFAFLLNRTLRLPRAPTRRAAATLFGLAVGAFVAAVFSRLLVVTGRGEATVALLGIAPIGFVVLIAAARPFGGLAVGDLISLAAPMWRRASALILEPFRSYSRKGATESKLMTTDSPAHPRQS